MIAATTDGARAQGLLDFLFGSSREPPPPPPAVPPPVNSYAEPAAPAAAVAPPVREIVRQDDGRGGRTVTFCVRLCDGENFPIEHSNATPVETCRAMCPASRTKVFYGSEIDDAVAGDGKRYSALANAFVYRKHLVASCTCNGRDVFGLAPFAKPIDPTLRSGDIVVTENGLMEYRGGGGGAAAFTPIEPSSRIAAELNSVTAPLQRPPHAQTQDDTPVIIVELRNEPPQYVPHDVELRGQVK